MNNIIEEIYKGGGATIDGKYLQLFDVKKHALIFIDPTNKQLYGYTGKALQQVTIEIGWLEGNTVHHKKYVPEDEKSVAV